MDIAILKEIDKITESHLKNCPCMNEEINETAKKIGLDAVNEIESNSIVKSSPSVGLDIISQNESRAREVIAGKHYMELCPMQSQYANELWEGFEKKYNLDNPQVSLIVSGLIVMALKAYKMNGLEILVTSYDKYGGENITLGPAVAESRKYLESLAKNIKILDEIENGTKITIKTELPSRKDLFGSSRYIVIDEDEKVKEKDL